MWFFNSKDLQPTSIVAYQTEVHLFPDRFLEIKVKLYYRINDLLRAVSAGFPGM